jgi:hypothetical protein
MPSPIAVACVKHLSCLSKLLSVTVSQSPDTIIHISQSPINHQSHANRNHITITIIAASPICLSVTVCLINHHQCRIVCLSAESGGLKQTPANPNRSRRRTGGTDKPALVSTATLRLPHWYGYILPFISLFH